MNKFEISHKEVTGSCSVVFVNYNTSDQIIEAISSLSNEPVENIIVVDNASPSDNPELIKIAYPEIELIKLAKNLGFGDGCNAGANWILQHTDCPYIFFLNPDTRVEPGCVARLTQRFADEDVGAVIPRITTMEEPPTLWYGGGCINWWKGSASVPGYAGSVNTELALLERDVSFATGCAFIIRREVFEQCGGFDPRFFMYEEDVEFSLRILSNGFRIRYAPDSIVRHACQGSLLKAGDEAVRGILNPLNPKLAFYVELMARNRWYTVWDHGSLINKIQYLTGGTLWWLRHAVTFLRHRRSDAVAALVRGWFDGLKSRKSW